MSLQVHFVSRLSEVLTPTLEYLRQPVDLFEKQHIVVPTAGVKAWLTSEVVKKLGTTDPDSQDGVVANVEIDFPGSLTKFIKPQGIGTQDPWLIENLMFYVLDVIAADAQYEPIIKRSGGLLIAARSIADRFDRYHVRRPAMIRLWEQGKATVSPTAHNPNAKQLSDTDMWQFELWSAVRSRIGQPSPPARAPELSANTPKQILVIGFQSLSPGQTDALLKLKDHVEVLVFLVHPSPAISKKWQVATEPTIGLIPERNPSPSLPPDIDPLINSWLLGSQELETLLMSQAITATHRPNKAPDNQTLLGHIQNTVTTELVATERPIANDDRSVAIHRCHNLGRQVEVLHDALLHAFKDLDNLQPHEIVIICPNIEATAPYLEATFARNIKIAGRTIKLPLVVADRGIRQINEGTELLARVIDVVQSRCSVDAVLSIATSPLVLKHLGVNTEGIEHWYRYADNANIRWGLTVEHRQRNGLDTPTLHAHTWRNALERTLLGALVPDGTRTVESLGVNALDDIDLSDIDDISALIKVFNAVLSLSDFTSQNHTTEEWCHALESSLLELCGEKCDDLATPLKQLGLLRASATNNSVGVPFSDVASIVTDLISQVPGRQPLRTGAITASSMIPLRGVPYRVVCLVGFDEEALSSSEGEGDDLIERQRLVGDQDTRLDVRRSLLDATLAAQDRLIITCTGQSIKNNQRLPPATPLAEFVDFARRLGVGKHPTIKGFSAFEVEHPRHATSARNFFKDQVQSELVWSHDEIARQAASTLGKKIDAKPLTAVPVEESETLTPEMLETAFVDPLDLYLRHTLDMFTYRKNEKEVPATIPTSIERKESARLAKELLLLMSTNPNDAAIDDWKGEVSRMGVLPPDPFGEAAIEEVRILAMEMQEKLAAKSIDISELISLDVDIEVASGIKLVGAIPMCTKGSEMVATAIYYTASNKEYEYKPALKRLAIRLLIARAVGLPVKKGYVLARHEDWPKDEKHVVRERVVILDESITQTQALARLRKLSDLARTALVSPCASFGKAAESTDSEMRNEFEFFVSGDDFHKSKEFIVFGGDPEFEDIFHTESPVLAFWKGHGELLQFPKTDNNPEYSVKIPKKDSGEENLVK